MANFKFSESDTPYWFNPQVNEGTPILVERDSAEDKAQVNLGFSNLPKGNRFRFNSDFDRTPTLVFQPGEFKKSINLSGVTGLLSKPSSLKIRINNVSEGDNFSRPSEIVVKLTTKSIKVKDKESVMVTATATTDFSKLEKSIQQLSTDVKALSTRLKTIEAQGIEDRARDQQTLNAVEEVDNDIANNTSLVEQVLQKLGINGSNTSTLDPITLAAISLIVKQILEGIGVGSTPMATVKTPDGKTVTLPMPTPPNCPPIATTVYQPVNAELQLVYGPCGGGSATPTMPTTVTCGTPTTPVLATLANGWMNTVTSQPFPNSYDKAGYYKDGGRIYLMGNVTGGPDQLETANKTKTIFTIPKECAPKTQQSFAVSGRTSNGGIEAVELIIYPNSDGSATVYAQNEGIIPQTIAIVGSYLLT